MGSSRRKLFTSIVSFALVAVMGVGAIIAVFAALVAHVDSGFNISYTASNVECIVTGTYSQRYGLKDQSLGDPIEFTAEAPDNDTRTFSVIPDVDFENSEDYLEFHFTIQNTGKNGFNVSVQLADFNNPNFKIEYTKAVRATGDTTPKFNFNESKVKLMDSYVTANGSAKEYLDIGVRISLIGKPTESASANGTFNFKLDGLAEKPTDIWDDDLKQFNKENLDKLLKMISGDGSASTTNMGTIDTLATNKTTAANFYNNVVRDPASGVDKKAGENIIVTLGGLTWNACYLSKDTQGNIILTLWLTSSQQKFFEDMPATEGEYYGYLDGSLYSDWAANWSSSSTSLSYPSSMYGTSYIRAVTLNNGGSYSTSGGESLLTYTKNKESLFALFTIEELGLANYIVKPKDVDWQKNGQLAKQEIGFSYNLSNENWQRDIDDTGFYSKDYNYSHKEKSDAWSEDYLWLPSMTETGYNSGTHGLWQLDVAQRKNGNLTSTSSVGNVGLTSGGAYNYSWLRSGNYGSATYSYRLAPSGLDSYDYFVDNSFAVRPALHLNLTAAAQALNG